MQDQSDNIIDFGKWELPKSWDDVSLKTFEEIERYYDDKDKQVDIRDIVHIMAGKTKDEVNQLPMEFLQTILEKLSFMETKPEEKEPTNKIEIDGETYQINFQNKLRTGEYVAAEMAMKADPHCFASLLGILCRKDGEMYDAKFENEILEERIRMFEKQPITKILPIVGFFLSCYILLETPSQLSMAVEEGLNDIQENLRNSTGLGLGRKLYIRWRMRKLQKSLRSISSI